MYIYIYIYQSSGSLLDWLLVFLVLFAVEDFDATLLGSWTAGQTAGQKTNTYSEVLYIFVVVSCCSRKSVATVPPVGGVVSCDVSRSIAAGRRTPEAQTQGVNQRHGRSGQDIERARFSLTVDSTPVRTPI